MMANDTARLVAEDTLDTSFDNDDHVTESLLDTEDSFMNVSPREKVTWDKMIEDKKKDTSSRKEKFDQWMKEVAKRKSALIPRMNKLLDKCQERKQVMEHTNSQIKRTVNDLQKKKNGGSSSPLPGSAFRNRQFKQLKNDDLEIDNN